MSGHQGGVALGYGAGLMPRFKAKVDRKVDTLGVRCPECKAEVKAPCTVVTPGHPRFGEPMLSKNSHRDRRRMAVRADNEARGIGRPAADAPSL